LETIQHWQNTFDLDFPLGIKPITMAPVKLYVLVYQCVLLLHLMEPSCVKAAMPALRPS